MENLRTRVFLLVLALTASVLISCDGKPEKLAPEKEVGELSQPEAKKPPELVQQLQDVRYSQTKDGKLQWELAAKSVQQVMEGPTRMQDVKMTYYAADGKFTVLTADSGVYNSATNDAVLRGNIAVTTSDGSTVKTDALAWVQKAGVLRGKDNVTITRGRSVIRGNGFELSPEHETFKIYHVQGTIRGGDINP
ncbi:MAG: LPS export ABC transporter periplasmic protein LptC [Candidatus Lindowbacteria bacterium]|nr:LPS export ABC transporter periplasmic protein LptC [Candidatus Lindowbacteria bacterium]